MAINKDNNCQITGNVSNVPQHGSFEGKEGPVSYCNFSIAHNHPKKGVMFFDCKAYGAIADNLKKNTSKGNAMTIWGELQKEEWKKKNPEDKPRYNFFFLVSEYKNYSTIYGSKDKPYEQQEMYSSNQPLPDTPARF